MWTTVQCRTRAFCLLKNLSIFPNLPCDVTTASGKRQCNFSPFPRVNVTAAMMQNTDNEDGDIL